MAPAFPPSASVPVLDPAPAPPQPPQDPGVDAEEVKRLTRRIDQLQAELRLYRGGRGAEVAQRVEELENENSNLEADINRLKTRIQELEDTLVAQGSDAKVQRADKLTSQTSEVVQQLNDVLSNLRINVMAAEGEFDQFALQIPRASFELIRESLRSSAGDVESAREIVRRLRDLGD
jgi:DNA repair ATPase RecN